jgi:hypothetical protein
MWSAMFDRLRASANRQVDIASLAAFRIIFGLVMFGGILRFIATGWIHPMYEEPIWFFKYPGFAWVEPWPAPGMYVHYGVLAALALAIAVGAYYRIAVVLFTLGFAYTQLIDVTNYLNHHYLVVLLGMLLAGLPANAAWSVDVRRDPSLARATVPAWFVWLLRFQIGVVYVFAGLAKAKADWLGDAQPLTGWLAARSETPLVGRWFGEPFFAYGMSWAGFLYDTTIVLWLSWRRTRLLAFAALIVFHGATGYLFNIGMFPIIMTSSALIFFSPSWPRRLATVFGRELPATPDAARASSPRRWVHRLVALHVTVQLLLPLRHLAYPGNVLWNEDGMRFAWHVLIREKHGAIMFVARFADGRKLEIPPNNYLTGRQEREMAGQPDLIVQLGKHVGQELRARGYPPFTLHVISQVSLNGRPPRPLIDPDVDVMQIQELGPRTYVLPAPP